MHIISSVFAPVVLAFSSDISNVLLALAMLLLMVCLVQFDLPVSTPTIDETTDADIIARSIYSAARKDSPIIRSSHGNVQLVYVLLGDLPDECRAWIRLICKTDSYMAEMQSGSLATDEDLLHVESVRRSLENLGVNTMIHHNAQQPLRDEMHVFHVRSLIPVDSVV